MSGTDCKCGHPAELHTGKPNPSSTTGCTDLFCGCLRLRIEGPDYHPLTTLDDLPTDELQALYDLTGVQQADATSPELHRARKWLSDALHERLNGPIKKHPIPSPGELQVLIDSQVPDGAIVTIDSTGKRNIVGMPGKVQFSCTYCGKKIGHGILIGDPDEEEREVAGIFCDEECLDGESTAQGFEYARDLGVPFRPPVRPRDQK